MKQVLIAIIFAAARARLERDSIRSAGLLRDGLKMETRAPGAFWNSFLAGSSSPYATFYGRHRLGSEQQPRRSQRLGIRERLAPERRALQACADDAGRLDDLVRG